MSKVPEKKYTAEHRESVKAAFFEGKSLPEAAAMHGVHERVARQWASKGEGGSSWHTQREEMVRSKLEDGFTKRKLSVAAAAEIPPELLLRGLQALQARDTPLSTQEMERVAAVHTALDRISRLDVGKSTENTSVNMRVKLSISEIREILQADPLLTEGNET